MADETLILEVEYDTGEAEKNIDELTQSIEGLKVAQQELKEQVQQGTVSQVKASKEQEKISVQLQQEKKQRRDLVKAVQSEVNSRDRLRQKISQLIRERNGLNMSTKEGAKRAKELEKQINKLDKQYKKTGTQTEKNKASIGGYSDAISNTIPGVGGLINVVKQFNKVLLATPLGWIIALIAAAGAAMKTFFTGSVEGQERWNVATEKGKGVLAVFKDELISAGKSLVDFGKNIKDSEQGFLEWSKSVDQKILAKFREFKGEIEDKGLWQTLKDNANDAIDAVSGKLTEIGDRIEENNRRAEIIAGKENALRRAEIEAMTETAELRRQIAELRASAADRENTTASERIRLLDEAINKQNEILEVEEDLAATRVEIQKLSMEQGENTLEDYEKLAELEKAQIDLETTNAERRRRFIAEQQQALRELNTEKERAIQLEKELAEEELAIDEEFKDLELQIEQEYFARLEQAQLEHEQRMTETKEQEEMKRRAIIEQTLASTAQLTAETFGLLNQLNQSRLDNELAAIDAKEQAALDRAAGNVALEEKIRNQALKDREKAQEAFAKKQKRIAIAESIINGALVVLNALKTQPFIPLGLIAAASAAVATGIQIAKIKNTQFAKGGQVTIAKNGAKFGTFSGPSHAGGGVDLYTGSGQHVANVEGKENFYVLNKNASDYINSLSDINQRIGGGVPLSQKSSRMQDGGQADVQSQERESLKDIFRNMPPIVVRTEDIKTGLEERDEVINAGIF